MAPLVLAGRDVVAAPAVAAPAVEGPAVATELDIVELRGGGMVRGKIVEVLPGVGLVIVAAADGRTLRFEWDEVLAWVHDGKTSEVFAGIVAQVDEVLPEPDGPRVHIEPTRRAPVELLEVIGETREQGRRGQVIGIRYRSVCFAPCDLRVHTDPPRNYFIGGAGVTQSRSFTLGDVGGDLQVQVKPGRRWMRHGGLAALGFGVVGLGVGGALIGVANIVSIPPQPDNNVKGVPPNYTPATAVLISSAALVIAGVTMFVLGKTRVGLKLRGATRRPRER